LNNKTTIGFNDNYPYGNGGASVTDRVITDKMLSDLELRLAAEGLPDKLNQKTLVLDPTTGQIVIGDGSGNPKVISCIKVIGTLDDLPVTGLNDMLYVAIFEKAFAIWDSSNNAYVKMGTGDSGSTALDKSVETYPSVANFPLEGEKDKLYVTYSGKSYFFVDGKYRPLFSGGVDAYTKEEADELFAKEEVLGQKADAESVYTKNEVDDLLSTVQAEKGEQGEKGDQGDPGKSAYDIASEAGFDGSEEEWLESLRGEQGADGISGRDGASAYEIAKNNGFTGTEEEWLESLKSDADVSVVTPDDIDALFNEREEQKLEDVLSVASLEEVDALFKNKPVMEVEPLRIASLEEIDALFQ